MSQIILQILCCILAADFLTGVAHWFEDTYALPSWPLLGKHVADPNIEHHLNPSALGSMTTFVSRNYQTVLAATAVSLAIACFLDWTIAWPLCLTLGLASYGNEVHAWNHRKSNSPLIRFLQDTAIVQTPQQHSRHHHPPFDRYYCTLTNVVNPMLEAVRFWRGCELLLSGFGVKSKRCSRERLGV